MSRDRAPQRDVGRLVADRRQGLRDRDAGLDEHGELTGEVHQLLLLDLLLGQLEVEHPRRSSMRIGKRFCSTRIERAADGVGLGGALDLGAGGVDC